MINNQLWRDINNDIETDKILFINSSLYFFAIAIDKFFA